MIILRPPKGWTGPVAVEASCRTHQVTRESERRQASALASVLIPLENLPMGPCVRERLDLGALHLHGWPFETAPEELFAFNPGAGQFRLLTTFGEGRRK